MGVSALVGLQWGDEGKGKVVDALAVEADIVVRAQGGANAGHTVNVAGRSRVLHLIPSGILSPGVTGVIANGVVVDPVKLHEEIRSLEASGVEVRSRLKVSDRAHLVMPWHMALDGFFEDLREDGGVGTTRRGIGPAYMDKASRVGIRADAMRDTRNLKKVAAARWESIQRMFPGLPADAADMKAKLADVEEASEALKPLVHDTVAFLNDAQSEGRDILLEGAQGALLDIDLGSYPYVTSSNCHLGGLLSGSGLPPRAVGRVIGVAKAYCTRVGSGPFPTEEQGPVGERLRARGHEFGATTGRPRRCGWLDLVALRFAVRTNGVSEVALTKADVLAGLGSLRVCTSYRSGGESLTDFPAGSRLNDVEPVYVEIPGFDEELGDVHAVSDLPSAVTTLIELVEDVCGVRVSIISTGPERAQTLVR